MQFDEKILTALEVLTDAAENDFELYRICTLVRDLIAPPVAEQVDEKHQRFNGVTYFQDNSGHYHANRAIHQAVWRYYHGSIPKGYDIHHDNENKADNRISNLVLLTRSEHIKIHKPKGSPVDPSRIKTFICDCCGKEYLDIDTGRNRYCPECRPVMKVINNRHYAPTMYEKVCPVCGKRFTVPKKTHQLCCSLSCAKKLAWLRGEAFTKIFHKTCPVCQKEFDTPYVNQIYCSKECKKEPRRQRLPCEKICENCGTLFMAPGKRTRCCSRKCASELRWKKRKATATQIELDFNQPSISPVPSKDSSASTL